MLVITRKNGQSVRIGDDIEIVVTQVSRGKIRIGIAAPPEVAIRRSELARHNRSCSAASTWRATG